MPKAAQLSDLQLAVLRVLWDRDEATVAEVHEALLDSRGLAPTTVATLLSRLEKRGIVTHRSEGRLYVYRARVAEDEVRRSMVAALMDRLFEGDPAELVNHLLTERQIGGEDLARLRRLIEDAGPEGTAR